MVKQLLAVALVLATQAGDSSCAPTPKACDLSFVGITVQDGRVQDTVTVTCKPRPVRHLLHAEIQYKPFDEWDVYGRSPTIYDIPGDGTEGGGRPVELTVTSQCSRGAYRTHVHTEGTGPATEQAPQGIPFEFEDTGWQKYVTAEDCAGGG